MSETTLKVRIQNRSDLEANWISSDPILLSGEIAVSSDKNNLFKVGNGISKWSELGYNAAVSAVTADFSNYSTQTLSDNRGQQIDTTYITGINVVQSDDYSVKITVQKGDETKQEYTFNEKDTTYDVMTAPTATEPGTSGLVPAPGAGDGKKFLTGAGTWESPIVGAVDDFSGATAESDGSAGLVPAPATGQQNQFLRGDGAWATPTDTTYSDMVGATILEAGKSGLVPAPEASSIKKFLSNAGTWDEVDLSAMTGATSINNGKSGLVPAPEAGQQNQFLRGDGTWATPENTTYNNASPTTVGVSRLYTSTGSNTDGSMTQDAITLALNSKSTTTHTHESSDIVSLDASKLTGTIDMERLPAGALERLVVVPTDTDRFALTTDEVQNGDTIKVNDTGIMYFVKDQNNLSSESGYEVYNAGAASSVPWSGITGKPSTYTPSTHTHSISDITDLQTVLDGKASNSHTHSFSNITGTVASTQLPTSGATTGTYKSVTVDKYGRVTGGTNPTTLAGYGITDAASSTHTHVLEIDDISGLQDALDGKSASGHTHNYLPLAGGTLTGNLIIKKATSESNAYGSSNPTLTFSNSGATQLISFIFTDYDSIANPASVTMIGNTGGEYFIAPNIKATGSIYEAGTALSSKYQAKGNYAGSSSDGGAATSAVKWSTARNINGLSINGEANRVNYGTCSTAAATAAKVVACTGFALITGSEITVKFTVTNTAANPTLNVNSTGAKAIYYRGAAISAGYLAANRTYTFRYNGTQYELVGDLNVNTDVNVKQGVTTTTGYRAVVLGTTDKGSTLSTAATEVTGQTYITTAVCVQPSTGDLRATMFNGYTLAAACAKGVTNLTAKAALGWADATTGATTVPTLNTLAYWNGCYSGTSSNLSYCNQGAFGAAATKAVTTSVTSGSVALITSGAVYTALADKAKGSAKSASTAATAGWYRIATSAAGISNCTGIFQIVGALAGFHTSALFTANTAYGVAASTAATILNVAHWTTKAISKIRIVYNTSYSNNYAYLEVYNPNAQAIPISVNLIGGQGWTLVAPNTAGSVPSGYSSKEYTLSNGTISGNMDFGEET